MSPIRHAEAQTISVELGLDGDALAVVVENDGSGFDPDAAPRGGRGLGNSALAPSPSAAAWTSSPEMGKGPEFASGSRHKSHPWMFAFTHPSGTFLGHVPDPQGLEREDRAGPRHRPTRLRRGSAAGGSIGADLVVVGSRGQGAR